jgi:hypothetical protein
MAQYTYESNSYYPLCYETNDTYMYWPSKLIVSGGLKSADIFIMSIGSSLQHQLLSDLKNIDYRTKNGE